MKRAGLFLLLLSLAWNVQANPLDDLLHRMKSNQLQENQEMQERLQRFRNTAAERKSMLDKVLAQIQAEEKLSRDMERAFRNGEKEMIAKREKLDQLTAHYKEVYATAKLWAVELREQFTRSVLGAQLRSRIAVV